MSLDVVDPDGLRHFKTHRKRDDDRTQLNKVLRKSRGKQQPAKSGYLQHLFASVSNAQSEEEAVYSNKVPSAEEVADNAANGCFTPRGKPYVIAGGTLFEVRTRPKLLNDLLDRRRKMKNDALRGYIELPNSLKFSVSGEVMGGDVSRGVHENRVHEIPERKIETCRQELRKENTSKANSNMQTRVNPRLSINSRKRVFPKSLLKKSETTLKEIKVGRAGYCDLLSQEQENNPNVVALVQSIVAPSNENRSRSRKSKIMSREIMSTSLATNYNLLSHVLTDKENQGETTLDEDVENSQSTDSAAYSARKHIANLESVDRVQILDGKLREVEALIKLQNEKSNTGKHARSRGPSNSSGYGGGRHKPSAAKRKRANISLVSPFNRKSPEKPSTPQCKHTDSQSALETMQSVQDKFRETQNKLTESLKTDLAARKLHRIQNMLDPKLHNSVQQSVWYNSPRVPTPRVTLSARGPRAKRNDSIMSKAQPTVNRGTVDKPKVTWNMQGGPRKQQIQHNEKVGLWERALGEASPGVCAKRNTAFSQLLSFVVNNFQDEDISAGLQIYLNRIRNILRNSKTIKTQHIQRILVVTPNTPAAHNLLKHICSQG